MGSVAKSAQSDTHFELARSRLHALAVQPHYWQRTQFTAIVSARTHIP